jgi:(2Fe-2S) ferredoxin
MATITFLTPTSVPVVSVNCLNKCNKGPNIRILTPDGAFVEVT